MIRINYNNIILFFTSLFYFFLIVFESGNGVIFLLITTLMILFLHLIKNNWQYKLFFELFHLMTILFAVYCIFTGIWAYDSLASFKSGFAIIKIIFLISILYNYYINCKKCTSNLLECLMWSGYFITFYSFYYYGIEKIFRYLLLNKRLENGYCNINSIAIILSFSLLISLFHFLYINKKINFINIFNIPAFLLLIATGSRKGFVLILIGSFLLIILKFLNKNIIRNIFKMFVLVILLIILLKVILSFQIFAGINERMEGMMVLLTKKGKIDHSSFLRQEYIKLGIKLFQNNFLFGIGMNNTYLTTYVIENTKTYLHNNYVELLAGGGILGFSLFYSMYVYLILKFCQYRKKWDVYSKFCIILMLLLLLVHYGSVAYYYKDTYFYLMIFFLEVHRLKMKKYTRRKRYV